MLNYSPSSERYRDGVSYRRCGASGLKFPMISLGLWHNFGSGDLAHHKSLVFHAFDSGITHFDLANNYGEVPGSAETNFGKILGGDLKAYRDELLVSSKAGYRMRAGPYGDGGSRKYLINSLNESLKRLKTDYVDIFYHHRPDSETPLEETMQALDYMVKSGKALYIGLSNYDYETVIEAQKILNSLGTRCIIHQLRYNLLDRSPEAGNLSELEQVGIGSIAFCPLAQGILTNRYLEGIPSDSRASRVDYPDLNADYIQAYLPMIRELNQIAEERNQSLAQMSIAWCLRRKELASVIIGASQMGQLKENLSALDNLDFSDECIEAIDAVLKSKPSLA